MIEVNVCRGGTYSDRCDVDDPQLNWGPDISDSLLSTEEAARERGRVEIDSSYSNRKMTTCTIQELTFIQPGSILGIVGLSSSSNGILRSTTIRISRNSQNLEVSTSMQVELEA